MCVLVDEQGPGTLTGPDWRLAKLWRSVPFAAHLVYSAFVLLFRMYTIRNNEKNIGTWTRKDWQVLLLKLGRLCFLGATLVIYLFDVRLIENPRIVNMFYREECHMQPTYNLDLLQFSTTSACAV